MIDSKHTFTIVEIAEASGVKKGTLYQRYYDRRRLGKMPAGLQRFTYEQVKQLLRVRSMRKPDPKNVAVLKRQLIDDGMANK